MPQVLVLHQQRKGYVEVIAPYNQAFVTALKESIWSSDRAWNPQSKRWEVSYTSYGILVSLLSRFFGDVDYATPADAWRDAYPNRTKDSPSTGPAATLFVSNDAPRVVIDAAYRALSKEYHPDHGGSHEKMRDLNTAYAALKKQHKS